MFITQKITNAIPLAMAQAYYGLPATRAYFVSLVTAICTYTNRTHAHTHTRSATKYQQLIASSAILEIAF